VFGREINYEQALAILGSARLAPQRLSRAQLESDRDAINRLWRKENS
jgi:hypothetical protein